MRFTKSTVINASPERVFEFHLLPDAFERLVPPWENAKILQKADVTKVGSRAIIEQKIFGLVPAKWVAEHTAYDPPKMFEDVQVSGPFKSWRHRHIVESHPEGAVLIDEIEFEPPMGFLGTMVAPVLILPKIEKMFDFRHEVTKKWCESSI
jgi:ligand-binding SRPBCC domain-containing protein